MLLRRITKHVKEQNWFAVGLDFIIVVVGILIAFQITSWNAARSNAASEGKLMERLENDLLGMRANYLQVDMNVKRRHQGWMYAFRALERCEANPAHQEAIGLSLAQYQSSPAPLVLRSAFDEMQATGIFSRLQDIELKNDVVTLYALLESETEANLSGRNNQLAAGRIMWKSIAFSYEDDDPYSSESLNSDAMGTAVFDPTQLCDNLELRGAIWEMVDLNRDWLNASAQFVSLIDSALARIAKTQ